MADWKHELSREQYEMMIDGILRASTIATVIDETLALEKTIDREAFREMIQTLRDRITECLVFGAFDDDDVHAIKKQVMASMFTRPDA